MVASFQGWGETDSDTVFLEKQKPKKIRKSGSGLDMMNQKCAV